MIPKPYFSVIDTSIGSDPAVVVVNSSLKTFLSKDLLPWHLRIEIECKYIAKNGMPTADEVVALENMENVIDEILKLGHLAALLARITCRSQRTLVYRVADPVAPHNALQSLLEMNPRWREWSYRMEQDPNWTLALPELRLIDRALDSS